MKIVNKVFYSIIAILIISNFFSMSTYYVSAGGMFDDADAFIDTGNSEVNNSDINITDIQEEFKDLGSVLTTIGAGVMVAVTTYMGIKYIMAGPETQAKLKQQLVGVIVSGIVIFGAYGIWKMVGMIAAKF